MYKIKFKSSAEKELKKLPASAIKKISSKIDFLSINPYIPGYVKLQGYRNYYRIRVSKYRIIYSIKKNILTIEIIKIGHRKSVYNNI